MVFISGMLLLLLETILILPPVFAVPRSHLPLQYHNSSPLQAQVPSPPLYAWVPFLVNESRSSEDNSALLNVRSPTNVPAPARGDPSLVPDGRGLHVVTKERDPFKFPEKKGPSFPAAGDVGGSGGPHYVYHHRSQEAEDVRMDADLSQRSYDSHDASHDASDSSHSVNLVNNQGAVYEPSPSSESIRAYFEPTDSVHERTEIYGVIRERSQSDDVIHERPKPADVHSEEC
nr:uncharacterized protein LOC128690623 [Cherax quadricarinatus]